MSSSGCWKQFVLMPPVAPHRLCTYYSFEQFLPIPTQMIHTQDCQPLNIKNLELKIIINTLILMQIFIKFLRDQRLC